MKITYQAEHEVSSAAAQLATGRSFDAWFAEFDKMGGPLNGRKRLGDYLIKEKKVEAWWTSTLVVEYEKSRGVAKGYSICATKSVSAEPYKVYEALLDASSWMGHGCAADLREGGCFDDGDGHSGTFKRLNPGKLMRFTWEGKGHQAGEEVEIKLTAVGAKTSIVLTHDRLSDRAAADGMRAAWGHVLDIIKEKAA